MDLFSYEPPPPPPSQAEAGRIGMELASDRAERTTPGWREDAFGYVQRFAAAHRDRDFLAEEIAPWAYEQGCARAPDDRAWGAIIQRAGREGVIEQTGLAAKNKLSGNASTWRPLWRSART